MKVLYWLLIALLNAGCVWCMWMAVTGSRDSKSILAIPFGAIVAIIPSSIMLIWTLLWKYPIGLLGLAIPCILIAWAVIIVFVPH